MSIKFEKYNTPDFKVVKDVFAEYPLLDPYLAHIVEEYLYATIRKYWDNGQLFMEYRVKGDIRDGECKTWDINGQLRVQCYYKEGKKEGEYKEWYENGQLSRQYYYKDGKEHGECKEWNKKGRLRCNIDFKEGKVDM